MKCLSLLFALFFSLTTTAAEQPSRQPASLFTEIDISQFLQNRGCKEENTRLEFLRLNQEKISGDILAYCQSDCGISGCSYHIFLEEISRPGIYKDAGNIDGTMKKLPTVHKGYFDLESTQSFGVEDKTTHTFQYDGGIYQ